MILSLGEDFCSPARLFCFARTEKKWFYLVCVACVSLLTLVFVWFPVQLSFSHLGFAAHAHLVYSNETLKTPLNGQQHLLDKAGS